MNAGNGVFDQGLAIANGSFSFGIAIRDVSGDGLPDVVTAAFLDSAVGVMLNDGMGSFAAQANYATGQGPASVATGLLDGNSSPDIVVAASTDNTVSVLLNHGNGTFWPRTDYAVGAQPYAVALGDVDGDGDTDIAVVEYQGHSFSILLNQGDGSFLEGGTWSTQPYPASIALGDLDGDGRVDVAVASAALSIVSVFLNDGNGTFGAGLDYPTGLGCSALALGDFNGDGTNDLVTINSEDSSISVFVNDGSGMLEPRTDYPAGPTPQSLASADLNGDGLADLATANSGSDSASVMLATCLAPPSCDDLNACTDDRWDVPSRKCAFEYNAAPCAAAACDNNTFHSASLCANGTCPLPIDTNCDDGNLCTSDSCDPAAGCLNMPNSLPCAEATCDNNVFHATALCENGECPPRIATDCDDGNVCTEDSCDAKTGCGHTNNTLSCAAATCIDNVFRAAVDCADGLCPVQLPADCNDTNVCTTDSCNPATGCEHSNNLVSCAASRCDGNIHSGATTCAQGACQPATTTDCDDGNICTLDACDAAAGCFNTAISGCCRFDVNCRPSGVCLFRSCDSMADRCDTKIVPVQGCCALVSDCDDDDASTIDSCNMSQGTCVNTPKCLADQDCADALECTIDACDTETGVCLHTPQPDCCGNAGPCPDGLSCLDGSCVELPDADVVDGTSEDVRPDEFGDVAEGENEFHDVAMPDITQSDANLQDEGGGDRGPSDLAGGETHLPDSFLDGLSPDHGSDNSTFDLLPDRIADDPDASSDLVQPESQSDVPTEAIGTDDPHSGWSQGGPAGGCSAAAGRSRFPTAMMTVMVSCFAALVAVSRRRWSRAGRPD
jgi:hypothetical protein